MSSPPGPHPWCPGWSHLRAYRDPLGFLLETAQQYPDIAYVRLGRRRDYIINHPDYIREALFGTEAHLLRGFNPILRQVMGNGLLSSQGEFHRSQRQAIQPLFHHQQVAVFSEIMVRHSGSLCQRWRDGEVRDLAAEMLQLSFTIIVDVLFGAEAGEAHALCRVVDQAIQMTGRKGYLRRYLASRTSFIGEGELERTIRRLDEIVYALIARQREGRGHCATLLSLLLELCRADGSLVHDDKQARDEAMTLLFAGHETIATALTWTWYLLSQHKEEERRLHEELDRVLGNGPPTIEDLPRLTYASAILSEAMRLYPPVWLVVRRPRQDWRIGDYTVPARSYLYLSPYSVQRDRRFFPNPNRFDPARWTSAQCSVSRYKYAYFPFGGGGRKCIGEYFALAEGILILATIAQSWRMRLVKNHPVDPAPLVTLRPKYGMRMTLERRHRQNEAVEREEPVAVLEK